MNVKKVTISLPLKNHFDMKMEAKNRGTTLSKLIIERFYNNQNNQATNENI
jgi:hypothetical protein